MSLDVLGRLGKLRDVLGWCGIFLYVFGCFLMFWWCFWGCSGTYWDNMDWNVHGVFWNLLGQFGMVLDSQHNCFAALSFDAPESKQKL